MKYFGGLIGLAFYSLIPTFFQFYYATKIEEEITHNLRRAAFSKLMLMPVPWYSEKENEGGEAAIRLAADVKKASTLVTAYVPVIITNIVTIVSGIVLPIAYLWQVGLLSLFALPMVGISGYISIIFISGYEDHIEQRYV